ncbi:PepSY domain-containing protein [Actinomadura algeriensis]|uniref:Membrane protein YkoI n=1 Tax=Actinomadura algeriensis TaxID=1679523 RepID=A0ABR9K2U2_9ACTN|nr:PepSY domain-containing protein [Actinomadura algeriensis]MBE1537161.1 putative membrane protein YkoI [Actinomadura algeriensis]
MTTSVAAARDDGDRRFAARVTALRAADTALKTVPGGHIEGLEVDYDGGRLVWEVDVLAVDGAWRELHLDTGDGHVLTDRVDRPEAGEDGDDCIDTEPGDAGSDPAVRTAALRSAKTTALRAARVARKEVPGAVTSVDFEYHRTAYAWEVDITADDGVEHKLKVDAASGGLISHSSGKGDD